MDYSIVYSTDNTGKFVEVARAAEQAGFCRAWVTENVGHDGLVQAAAAVEHTTRIGIGTGILYAFTRSPVGLAIAAQNLANRSEGRFTLGIGAGTRGLRRRYGAEFDHPAPRLVEYAQLMKQVFGNKSVEFNGDYYQAALPAWGRQVGEYTPAVYGSGLNAIMLKYAAREFDGVALHPLAMASPFLEEVVTPSIQEGAADRNQPPRLAAWVLASVGSSRQEARSQVSRALAFYFSTPSYRNAAEGASWSEAVATIRERFADTRDAPDWGELGALVPQQMIDDLAVWGTPDEVRPMAKELEVRLAAAGVEEVTFQSVGKGTEQEAYKAAMSVISALRAPN